jgi:peptidoglycan/xylan/chitin deacetylase (PgdA/CDA1 family)
LRSRTPSAIATLTLFLGLGLARANDPQRPSAEVVATANSANLPDFGLTAERAAPTVAQVPIPERATDSITPLVERARRLREQLLDQPAERLRVAPEYEQALRTLGATVPLPQHPAPKSSLAGAVDALAAGLVADQVSESEINWVRFFMLKGYLLLSLVDKAREAEHVKNAQVWLDQLTLDDSESMDNRDIAGVRVVTRGDPARREIALTMDGGPSETTGALLDYLKQEDVKVTFFLLGCFAKDAAAALCRRIPQEGHVVANHTMTHAKWKGLARIPANQAELDIAQGVKVIGDATGVTRMELFRPPYGSGAEQPRVCQIIARYHPYSIMWTIDTLDSMGAGLARQISRVLDSRKLNGSIILTHDHSKSILQLVRRIVPVLKRRGYRFVTVPELLAHAEERIKGERLGEVCVELRDGQPAVAYQRAMEMGKAKDPLSIEALDLAYMIARLYPQVAGAESSIKSQFARLFPRDRLPWEKPSHLPNSGVHAPHP